MGKLKEFLARLRKEQPKIQEIPKTSQESSSIGLLQKLKYQNFGGWKSKFISDVYEERILYPHEEMEIARKAFLYNAHVHAAATAISYFLLGGELKISSKDKDTETWGNDTLRKTGLKSIVMQYLFDDVITTGNFYSERMFEGKEIVAYDYIPDSDRIYHDLDDKGMIKSYLQKLPDEQLSGVQYKTIKYYGDRRKAIKGIEIAKNKIFHCKIGCATIPSYGRGLVCCIINDIQIILEVERAIAVIARYKAIPKKLLMLLKSNGPRDVEEIANALNNVGDDENPIIPFEMKDLDLSYNGKELNFEPILNYLKKKLTVALAPSFLIHGDETTYAVSKEQRAALELKVNAIRSVVSEQLKREIRIIANSVNKNLADFEIEYGTYDLGQDDEARRSAIEAWNAGIITLNEARETIGYDNDDDNGEFYSFELKPNVTEQTAPGETVEDTGKETDK